ncbi:MAG: replicative DNA helicase [Fimbriimonadaceae bacterium]|nr:replicative DNA helicase [Chitinophagales bacterium]
MAELENNTGENIRNNERKRRQPDLSSIVYGKLPPQAIDLEEAVLGAFMIDRDAVTNAIEILRPESFYDDRHRIIFTAIRRLFEKTQPIDLLTVTEELRKMGQLEEAGGPFYITTLTNRVASAAHIEHHARIVAQKFIQRELIKISSEIINESYEDTTDVFELLDKAEQNLFNIADKNLRTSYNEIHNLISSTIKEIDEARSHEDSLTGCPSGFTNLDRLTGGWQKSDLIIVAARPSMGKTAFTLSLARNAAVDFNKGVAIFSLEMSAQQLVKRLLSAETELPAEKIIKGHLAEHEMVQLVKMSNRLSEAKLFIDDTPAINIFELRAKCRRLKMQHDIQLVVIDYLQLMTTNDSGKGSGNREQEISQISRSLKSIAKELNIPIIALSQLSRKVEDRGGNKRPMLSDLRESGAIEQDADIVMFLYRPEYYGLDVDENGNPTKGIAEVIISKHRNGALDTIRTKFIDRFIKFVDLDEFYTPGNLTPLADAVKENKATITRSSKANDTNDDDDIPF